MHGYRDVGWKCAGKQDVEHGATVHMVSSNTGDGISIVARLALTKA